MGPVTLNRRLVLEEAQHTPDGAGGQTATWAALGTLWARVVPGTGREAAGEAVSLSLTRYRIVIRAAPHGAPSRPRPGQRFRDGTRLFQILSVAEHDTAGRYLTCHTQEEMAV